MILIDSNVLIDVIEQDPNWHDWSFGQIEAAVVAGRAAINPIVIAETAPRTGSLEHFEARLSQMLIEVEPLSNISAYRAGAAFQAFKRKRIDATAKSVLADFLIGGHAQSLGATVLTRDPRFYRTYFPTVPLITPETTEP